MRSESVMMLGKVCDEAGGFFGGLGGSGEDVFEGTRLQGSASQYGFGLYVLRGGVPEDAADSLAVSIESSFRTPFRTGFGKDSYSSWSAAHFPCTCRYGCAGTKGHRLHTFGSHSLAAGDACSAASDCAMQVLQTLFPRTSSFNHFNFIVTDLYERDERSPFHAEAHPTVSYTHLTLPTSDLV